MQNTIICRGSSFRLALELIPMTSGSEKNGGWQLCIASIPWDTHNSIPGLDALDFTYSAALVIILTQAHPHDKTLSWSRLYFSLAAGNKAMNYKQGVRFLKESEREIYTSGPAAVCCENHNVALWHFENITESARKIASFIGLRATPF